MTTLGRRPGRDRRAQRHPGAQGRLRDDTGRRVGVVGGGIAGLAAACALAERGVAVTLFEREDQFGGRVRAWPLADGRTMSRGFHAFFRQYYNLRGLLRRADPDLERLHPVGDYPLQRAGGQRESFLGLPHTPPWNMLAFVVRSPAFGLRELSRVHLPSAHELISVDFPRTFERYDGESAAHFLDRLNFPPAARTLALEVFSRSFFADPHDFAAGELVAMFHAYFLGSSEGLLFDVPTDDYDAALWRPLTDYLRRVGVELRAGEPVERITAGGADVTVHTAGDTTDVDAVVLATDLVTTQRLAAGASGFDRPDAWGRDLATLRTSPPFAVCRWWFDRPARPERPGFLGTAGYDLVDNLSVLERFESGAARWAADTGGSVVEAHAYALNEAAGEDELERRMRAVLDEVWPEYRDAGVVAREFLLRDDCPLVDPAPVASRPPVATPDPRLVLAGDGIRCEFPVALMERAATTGFQAANTLLEGWGLAGHDLWTVPLRSRYLRRSA